MPLIPRSGRDWVRSLAHALFAGCLIVCLVIFWVGSTQSRVLRYAGYSIGPFLMSLALGLGLICLAPSLDKRFRKCGAAVAVFSFLVGFLTIPALAE
ncbi:hypothetical protein Cflav_PD0475 [Pedosphaera parvula Ellin514]|uniref:Uncharacterized protein n=1 Tax=Pedosphaera parvula (strain Ellin514) TaxID=320771 RepID=B9XRC0_PEDPL|nr:hypothetical protein Cflav_PD0475 [Pedosphaera parvula Ellin514]